MGYSLSNRLICCCKFIHSGDRVADIGCDHGYLGIHLLQTGGATHVIAADIHEGPLQSAMANAAKYGVKDIQFYLSDGAGSIPRDFDVMVCAGMGADTIISILEAAPWLRSGQYRLVLQCQSRRPALRQYLTETGFAILREDLARDGKFIYPVMEVSYAPGQVLTPAQYHISPALLSSGSPLLPAFMERVKDGIRETVKGLERSGQPEKSAPYREILKALEEML